MSARVDIGKWAYPRVREGWKEQAACSGEDPELWFPKDRDERQKVSNRRSTLEAKAICVGCPVRADCLTYAITVDVRYGIWGGLSEREREKLTGKRRNWK